MPSSRNIYHSQNLKGGGTQEEVILLKVRSTKMRLKKEKEISPCEEDTEKRKLKSSLFGQKRGHCNLANETLV